MRLKLLQRIRKIKGQLKGIEKMITEKRNCMEIIQQIKAVKAALEAFLILFLTEESCRLMKKRKPKEFAKIMKELVKKV